MLDAEIPCVAERYVTANMSSNLKCETRDDAPLGAVGVVIAAGWSPARIGALLMRLHTRADRAGLEQVHEQIMLQAQAFGIERSAAVAAAVLSHWLKRACGACTGRKFELVAGTPSLSARPCKLCHGTGEAKLAYGDAGKRLSVFLDDCKSRAVDSIKSRLRATR